MARRIHHIPRVFADLKRRRVFRVVAVYGAAGFAILQGVELIQPVLSLPGWVYRATGILLLVGFPVAVVLAWIYDFDDGLRRTAPATPEELDAIVHLPRTFRWASGMLALAGAGLLIVGGWFAFRAPRDVVPSERDGPVVAVLPFANRSALPEDGYFVDGLHDDILIELSRISSLLHATAILEGAVQRSGNRVRVSMQLVDAATEAHLWAEQWDTELTPVSLLAIQDTLALDIATALRISLAADERERLRDSRTRDLSAYDAFLMGQSRLAQLTRRGIEEAVALFRAALERDPQFSDAHAGLAVADGTLATFVAEGDDAKRQFAEADAQADRALVLKPSSAYALLAKAIVALGTRRDVVSAESLLLAAQQRRPGDPVIKLWHVRALMIAGRFAEAVDVTDEVLRVDPLSGLAHAYNGFALWGAGRTTEADAAYRQALALDPGYAYTHLEYAVLLAQRRDEVRMWSVMIGLGGALHYDRPDSLATIAAAVFHPELRQRALEELDRLLDRTPLRETDVIPHLALLGADARAAAAAKVAVERGSPWTPFFRHPLFAALTKR
jgi:TolB-like protein